MEPIPLVIEEEIALEGLDGITPQTFWFRLSERLNYPLPFGENFKQSLWNIILKHDEFEFFEIEKPRLTPARLDRLQMFSDERSDELDKVIAESYSIYTYHPVDDPEIRGSCQEFKTRKKIDPSYMQSTPFKEIEKDFGNKLVVVASQRLRNKVLIAGNIGKDCDINNHTYCVLERIGRGRYFGEATSGPNSINSLIKDSKLIHYFRNSLIKNNLVMRQQIQAKIRGKAIQIQLFHLPRFFVIIQVNHMVLTEKLFNFLMKKPPSYGALADDARAHLNLGAKTFRNFIKSKQDIFIAELMKKSEINPIGEDEESKVKERMLRCVRIRDPTFDVFTLFNDVKEEVEEEIGYLDESRQVMNTSLVWQVGAEIEKSGSEGLSQAQIAKHFGLSRLGARAIIRKVTRHYDITCYLADEGRNRISRYVHKKYKQDKSQKFEEEVNKLVQKAEELTAMPPPVLQEPKVEKNNTDVIKVSIPLKMIQSEPEETEVINIIQNATMEEPISSNENSMLDDCFKDAYTVDVDEPCVFGNIENVEAKMTFLNTLPGVESKKGLAAAIAKNKVSVKLLSRVNVILDILKEKKIIDGMELLNLLREKEKNCKEKMCRKSLLALCNQLASDNFLKVIEIELKSSSKTIKMRYLGEPNITLDMRCWHSIIEELKLQHFLRPINEDYKQEFKIEPSISGLSFVSNASVPIQEFSAPSIKYHKENFPKFQKYKLFHEFLYYLIYDNRKDIQKIPIQSAIAEWKKDIQNIPDLDEVSSRISKVYTTERNWKMFIPPLNPYRDYEDGWGLLRDIIHRVPLILYVKFTRYGGYVQDLKEYLEHPIKCNYLIHFLPPAVKNSLFQGRKHVQVFYELCKRMVFLGLLQMGPNRSKEIDYTYVYLNRNASILNTTTSSGQYAQIDNKEYDVHRYHFNSPQVIADYWADLMDICINTPIGKTKDPDFEAPTSERVTVKPDLLPYLAVQNYETAPQNDNGDIPGDKRGAGGLDTWLYSHSRLNWSKDSLLLGKRKATVSKIKSTKRLKQIKEEKDENDKPVAKVIAVRKRIRKKTTTITTKRIITKAETLTGINRRSIIRKTSAVKKVKTKILYDEVDKNALKLIPSGGRCMWSDIEDETLLLIKAAMKFLFKSDCQCTYFCPSVVIRDILHWRTPKGLSKTNEACKRRILYLLKKPENRDKFNRYLEELLVIREFKRKAIEFNKMLTKYKKSSDIRARVKIFLVELVYRMHQYFLKQFMSSSLQSEKIIELPFNDIENIQTVIFSPENNDYKYREPTTPKEAEITSLASLIHSGLASLHDKTSNEYYLYETYKKYTDHNLSEATNSLRRLQVISAKTHPSKSKYKLSNRYALLLSSLHISVELYDEYLEVLKNLSKYDTAQQMKSVNCGTIFMLAEMIKQGKIKLTLEKADKLIMVDPSLKKKTNFEEITDKYMAAQKEDEMKTQEKIKELKFPNDSTSDVKFYHSEDPIEIFFKFNDFYLHIFCLLNALDGEETIKTDRFNIEDEKCSLKVCIFDDGEIGANIRLIATETQSTIEEILESCVEDGDVLTKENFLSFFNKKINEFEAKSKENYRKDVGKCSIEHENITAKFLLRKIQQLNENEQEDGAWLTEYKKSSTESSNEIFDEEEEVDPIKPSLISNQLKELNVSMRSSDSFVVNLSTIYMEVCGEKCGEFKIDGDLFDKRLISFDQNMRNSLFEKIKRFHVWLPEDLTKRPLESELLTISEDIKELKELCEFIIEKGEIGATANEVYERFSNKILLHDSLKSLIQHKIIIVAGVNQFRFIYKSYSNKWLIETLYLTEDTAKTDEVNEAPSKKPRIDEEILESTEKEPEAVKKYIQHPYHVLPAPWIRVGPLNRTINQRCLDKWLGTILNFLTINPGILLTDLRNKFNILNLVQLRELCDVLQDIGCIKLMVYEQLAVDIFSEYCHESDPAPATYLDPFEKTFLEVSTDALCRLSVFIGNHYYKQPFI